jgi:hypothetical protein
LKLISDLFIFVQQLTIGGQSFAFTSTDELKTSACDVLSITRGAARVRGRVTRRLAVLGGNFVGPKQGIANTQPAESTSKKRLAMSFSSPHLSHICFILFYLNACTLIIAKDFLKEKN